MNFDEEENMTKQQNVTKNRRTLIILFVMFITPVALAYAAYFGDWFSGSGGAKGILINSEEVTDIEDYVFIRKSGEKVTGKEFETLYWWLVPIDPKTCDQACMDLNLHTVNQVYIGLGKEASRINELAILPTDFIGSHNQLPFVTSEFSDSGVKAFRESQGKKTHDLEANYIYLVDPLGNIFMKYPFIKTKGEIPLLGKSMRKDILHLFKYSRLG